jgi:hypothetical protein
MPSRGSSRCLRPRELRRRVLLPATVNDGRSSTNARILNVSSHGLLIHSGRQLSRGTEVEIRYSDHVIVGRIAWHAAGKVGMRAHQTLPVEDILIIGRAAPVRQIAFRGGRHMSRRTADQSRLRARAIQLFGVLIFGTSLAIVTAALVERELVRPLTAVSAALSK